MQTSTKERVAEVATVIKPSLIIMDGRKCFTERGPDKGKLEEPNILMASNDMVAIDVEGLKILQSYKADNKLGTDPWALKQITRGIELGIGSKSQNDYQIIEL